MWYKPGYRKTAVLEAVSQRRRVQRSGEWVEGVPCPDLLTIRLLEGIV